VSFRPEPPIAHDAPRRTAVLLVNLGTPDAPTTAAVRRYLREFLSDPRVVEIPRPIWWLILHGIILRTRPARSAEKYASIWSRDGSPLKVHTERQTQLLRGYLGERIKAPLTVAYAMRYGSPSIASALTRLQGENVARLLVVPLYPQYAASTTATVFDEVARFYTGARNVPELRFVRSYADHPAYIVALVDQLREHFERNGRPDRLVMSFHGVPRFTLDRGDPYHCECHLTARLLAEALGLAKDRWAITFQSRFGRAEWLKPYTAQTLEDYARAGVGRVDVITPGFVGDCLETLEEIGIEAKETFTAAGGREFFAVPCLNERPAWIRALTAIVAEHLGSWVREPWDRAAEERRLAERKQRALALGAER
jgi:protoporphyrin/coproporphyrin ferrochelatase